MGYITARKQMSDRRRCHEEIIFGSPNKMSNIYLEIVSPLYVKSLFQTVAWTLAQPLAYASNGISWSYIPIFVYTCSICPTRARSYGVTIHHMVITVEQGILHHWKGLLVAIAR